ncbi:aminotransferase class III-fold pyridoxal phosphate-dependent enzyme [Pikeienuella sp. HZG-20]|uniref:aminotransferase class III-fold pyridoxal phosphate-dependent enzyme n=1 Tax=Paludibacillus litoralis TaxID=3133267 RepID=UPI0030ED6F4C
MLDRRAANTGENDAALMARAKRVVPGGLWGHMSVSRLPEGYPQFFSRGEGCRIWDTDGNELIDFMCGYGPIVLGHRDRDVDAAVARQMERGELFNGPAPVMVDLAELVVDLIPHADWALFCKNGGDATTTGVTLARAETGRRKILVARGSYHGSAPWCTPSLAGVTDEDRAHILHYDYNDPASLTEAVEAAGDDLAAILCTALRHDARRDQELATREFAEAARALCDRTGAALMIDDVRAGFRLAMGGSWEPLGVRPDISTFGKAMGNGHPISMLTATERFRDAAQRMFVTGSYWCGAGAMAASLATLTKLRETDGLAHMERIGQLFRDGLNEQAARHGVRIRQTGPAQMPLILFDADVNFAKGDLFCLEALRRGVFLHPWHNMFLSTAHRETDIAEALTATDAAFGAVANAFG